MPKTPTAAEFLRRKVNAPSEMLTRDWRDVSAEVRERAFFMASVTQGEVLDAYREGIEAVERGDVNAARGAEMIRERLLKMGYQPAPGTAGSIKDVASWRRLRVTIDTNVRMARGHAGYARQLAAAAVFPAKRMVREIAKKEPRNWAAVWRGMGNSELQSGKGEGVNVADMSAHIAHPVWRKISRFGVPYPPYDFGSGMGDKPLRLDEARRLGVDKLPPPRAVPEELTATPAEVPGVGTLTPSLNESLEATPDIRTDSVRQELAAQMRGTARWEGDKLVYLDPNGTRPDTADNLAALLTAPTQGPAYQRDAAALYATEGPQSFTAGSDALYDFARLIHRTQPMDAVPVLWSGRSFASEADRAAWLRGMENSEFQIGKGFPWLACALEALGAVAQLDASQAVSVVLNIRRSRRARDLRAVLNAVAPGSEAAGIFIEPGATYRILSTQQQRSVLQVIIEEVEP